MLLVTGLFRVEQASSFLMTRCVQYTYALRLQWDHKSTSYSGTYDRQPDPDQVEVKIRIRSFPRFPHYTRR